MVVSFIIFGLLAITYRKDYGPKYSYFTIILLFVRQAVRLLDFEKTKHNMEGNDWHVFLVLQSAFILNSLPLMTIMFNNQKYNKLIIIIFFAFSCACISVGMSKSPDIEFDKTIFEYIPGFLICTISYNLNGRHITSLFDLIYKKGKLN